jgi:hypothetical protein
LSSQFECRDFRILEPIALAYFASTHVDGVQHTVLDEPAHLFGIDRQFVCRLPRGLQSLTHRRTLFLLENGPGYYLR